MYKKSILLSKLLYEMGQEFLEIQYVLVDSLMLKLPALSLKFKNILSFNTKTSTSNLKKEAFLF